MIYDIGIINLIVQTKIEKVFIWLIPFQNLIINSNKYYLNNLIIYVNENIIFVNKIVSFSNLFF